MNNKNDVLTQANSDKTTTETLTDSLKSSVEGVNSITKELEGLAKHDIKDTPMLSLRKQLVYTTIESRHCFARLEVAAETDNLEEINKETKALLDYGDKIKGIVLEIKNLLTEIKNKKGMSTSAPSSTPSTSEPVKAPE